VLKKETLIISLGDNAVRIGVCSGGELVRSDRRFVPSEGLDALWRAGLRPLDDALRSLLRDLQVRPGTPAMVVFHSPSSFADIYVAPSTGSAAKNAAMLNLRQTVAPMPGGWQMRAVPVRSFSGRPGAAQGERARDQAPSEQAAPSENTKPAAVKEPKGDGAKSTLMLTLAESNECCDVIARCMERVGVRVYAILPARAGLLVKGLRAGDSTGNVPVVRVHVCEQTMTLMGWANGQLLFSRCTDAGYGLLTEALHRSAKNANVGDDFTRETAARTLFTVGIPSENQVLDATHNLRGEHALPLMQPALQRCIVEIRQTLRFGMSEVDLDRSNVIIDGPGASIPGFVETLSAQLERPLQSANVAVATAVAEDMVGDLPVAASMLDASELWLVPACEEVRRNDIRLGVAMRAGAGAAMLALGLMAWQAFSTSRVARQQASALQSRVSEVVTAEKTQRDLATIAGRATQVRTLLTNGLGDVPDWVGVLAMIGEHGIEGLELADISFDSASNERENSTVLTLRGRALATSAPPPAQGAPPDAPRPRDGVASLLQYLEKSPLVVSARIVTNRIESGGRGAREFVVSVELKAAKPLPPDVQLADEGESADNLAEAGAGMEGVSSAVIESSMPVEAPSLDAPSPATVPGVTP
jgi:hypothetical protein